MIDTSLMLVEWDKIFYVLRLAAPKLGRYGGDMGGDAVRMLAMLRNDDLLQRVAREIWDADIKLKVALAKSAPEAEHSNARKDYSKTLLAIAKSLR